MGEKTIEFTNIGPCRSKTESFSGKKFHCYEAETLENGQSIIWKLYSKSDIKTPSLQAIEQSRTRVNEFSPLIITFEKQNLAFAKQKMIFVIVDEDKEDGTQIGYWKDGTFSPVSETFSPSSGTFGILKNGKFTPCPKGGKIVKNRQEYDYEGIPRLNLMTIYGGYTIDDRPNQDEPASKKIKNDHDQPNHDKPIKNNVFKKNKSKRKNKSALKKKKSKSKNSLKKKK
jgi:hypothetical protein